VHETEASRQPHQSGAVAQTELSVDAIEVGIDRLARDAQLAGDLLRLLAIGRQPKHLVLPFGQNAEHVGGASEIGRHHRQLLGQARRDVALAAAHSLQRFEQGVCALGLEHVADGAGCQRVAHVLDFVVPADDQDLHFGPAPQDLARREHAVHPGKDDVHQHHVGPGALDQLERHACRTRLAHHLVSRGVPDQLTYA
jgi:hypothetical protein